MDPFNHPVTEYALSVIRENIIAGELVHLACHRHLDDLESAGERGLYFDCEAANREIKFARLLNHTTGDLAGTPFILQPWQVFRHGSIFGWKYIATGKRRFRSSYHQVAKKNGKTTDTAVPMIYAMLMDGEAAPQGFAAATTRDQAGLLFTEVSRMIKGSQIGPLFDIQRHSIECPATNGIIKSLSRDGGAADGINPHFAAMDELHRWQDRELAEVVRNSMIARSQPIEWMITTAGASKQSYCGEVRRYAENVLRGRVQDDSFFAYVAEPPETADPGDPKTWAMGNPNLNVSVPEEQLKRFYNEACAITGRMPNFRRLHLNLWTEGANNWIAPDVWDAAGGKLNIEDFFGMDAWAGLDLSSTTDLSALAIAIPKNGAIYLFVFTFFPIGPKNFLHRAQTENKDFISWKDEGWLLIHDDAGAIDEDKIIEKILWVMEKFNLKELAFDPHGMASMKKALRKSKVPMLEHRQGFLSMSPPMKEF
ncbi:MAG: terminase, partial [Rhodobacteraceae bacterium]|nr:terminase [Paracoccaceae bacterium]